MDYNKFMGGVDLLDQMTKYYAIDKKSQNHKTDNKIMFSYSQYRFLKQFCTL
jgi:hypothetical protein